MNEPPPIESNSKQKDHLSNLHESPSDNHGVRPNYQIKTSEQLKQLTPELQLEYFQQLKQSLEGTNFFLATRKGPLVNEIDFANFIASSHPTRDAETREEDVSEANFSSISKKYQKRKNNAPHSDEARDVDTDDSIAEVQETTTKKLKRKPTGNSNKDEDEETFKKKKDENMLSNQLKRSKSIGSSSSSAASESSDDHREYSPELNSEGTFGNHFNEVALSPMNVVEEEDLVEPMDQDVSRQDDDTIGSVSLELSCDQSPKNKEEATNQKGETEKEEYENEEEEEPIVREKKSVVDGKTEKKMTSLEKKAMENEENRIIFRGVSFLWYIIMLIKPIRDNIEEYYSEKELKDKKITEKRVLSMQKFVDGYMKTQCKKYLNQRMNLNTRFHDEDNYRFCKKYFTKMTMKVEPFQKEKGRRPQYTPEQIPPLSFTGPLHIPLTSTSKDIAEAAVKFLPRKQNTISANVKFVAVPDPNGSLHCLERELYEDSLKGTEEYRMSVPVLELISKKQMESRECYQFLNKAPITAVKNFGKILEIETSLFDPENVAKLAPEQRVPRIPQVPQSADNNFTPLGEKLWNCPVHYRGMDTTAKEQVEYIEGEKTYARKVYERLATGKKMERNDTITEMMTERIQNQNLPFEEFQDMFAVRFGTNIDLTGKKFKKLFKELDKLPFFLRPALKRDLLSHCTTKIFGVNTVQMYMKVPGTRTPAHMENSLMASLNWNVGPGTCIWFSVPYEYWGRIQEMVNERRLDSTSQNYWPSEKELMRQGIPVIKFEQGPDTMVYVNTGTFHWVQSQDFCVNVSWNIGQPTFNQLAASMIAYDNIRQFDSNEQVIPLATVLTELAAKKVKLDDVDAYKVVRAGLTKAIGHQACYFNTLKAQNTKVMKVPTYPTRCDSCNGEIFNIIRRMQLKKEYGGEDEEGVYESDEEFDPDEEDNVKEPEDEYEFKNGEDEDSKDDEKESESSDDESEYNSDDEEVPVNDDDDDIPEEDKKPDGTRKFYVYCGTCMPPAEDFEKRELKYTCSWFMRDLYRIYDNYRINIDE